MKKLANKIFLLVLMVFSLALASNVVLAQVYKTVDKDGNVTYTDQPPADGAAPVDLAPLSIIEAPTYEPKVKADEEVADGKEGKEMSIRYLRKHYADFAIVAPQQEESVWHPDEAMTVAWNTRYQLQEGMQVTIFIDGAQHSKTTDQIIAVTQLDRGEHTVTAQLSDARNQRIATAEPVTFFIRRPGLYNRPRVAPQGGG